MLRQRDSGAFLLGLDSGTLAFSQHADSESRQHTCCNPFWRPYLFQGVMTKMNPLLQLMLVTKIRRMRESIDRSIEIQL